VIGRFSIGPKILMFVTRQLAAGAKVRLYITIASNVVKQAPRQLSRGAARAYFYQRNTI